MKKFFFLAGIVASLSMVSCGPSEEEQKQIQEDTKKGTDMVDSLFKAAEQNVKDSGAVQDTGEKK